MRFLSLLYLLGLALRTVLWTAAFAVALVVSVDHHLQLSVAHRIARDLTVQFVNGEIRGELQIGRIDELSLEKVVAHHAQLFDGEGRRIITGDRVELEPDFMKLRQGLLRFRVGRVTGGTVRLVSNENGDPSLFTTFDPKHPSPPGTGGESIRALVDQLVLEDLNLYGQLIAVEGVRAEHLYARGRLYVGKLVQITIANAQAQVVKPYDFVGKVERLSGTISTDPAHGTKLSILGTRGAEDVHVNLSYREVLPGKPLELDLDLVSARLSTDTLRRVGYAFAGPLAPDLQGRVQLSGPPDKLILTAHVESAAGNADITGVINASSGVAIKVVSDRIQVDKLVDDAPAVHARGIVHVEVGPEPDAKPQVHAEIGALRYRGVLVPAFVLDGELEDNGLRIEKARATQGGQIALRGRVGFDGHTDLHIDARFSTLQKDPNLSRFVADLHGSLQTSLHIRTPGRDQPTRLDIDGKLELIDASYGSVHAQHLLLNGKAHGDPALPQLDVDVQAGEVQILQYKLGNAHFTLHGGPKTYAARGEFEAKGQKTFSFDASVTANHDGFVVQAEPIEFTVGTESWRGALQNLQVLHERSIELGFLRLASRAQRLEAQGILRVDGEDSLHAQLQNFDVTALRAVLGETFPLSFGFADANLELRGDVDKPELSVTGALRQATLAHLDKIDALYTISYLDGHLEVDTDIDLQQRGTLQLLGQGELDAAQPDPLDALRSGLYNLSLTGSKLDLTLFPQLENTVKAGRIDGSLEAQGGLDAITLDGRMTVTALQVSAWAPLTFGSSFKYVHNELTTQLSLSDAQGTLARAHVLWPVDWHALTTDRANYLAEQWLSQNFRVQGQTNKRALSDLPFELTGPLRGWPVQLDSTFLVTRSTEGLKGDATATLTPVEKWVDPNCKISSNSKLRSHFILSNERVDLQLEALLDEHSVSTATGKFAWPFERFLRGQLPMEKPLFELNGHVGLDQLERVPGLCRHGHGELQADFAVRGAGSDTPETDIKLQARIVPQALSANGVVSAPVQRCEAEPLLLQGVLHGKSDGLTATAHAQGCSGGRSELQAKLAWNWNANELIPKFDPQRETSVRLGLQDAEMEPLLDYLPGVRGFSGKASGQLNAHSQHGKVDVRGQIALAGGRLYAIPTGQQLSDVSLVMVANGNWLKLDTLSARIEKGSFQLAGGISLDGWVPRRLQLGLVMQDLPIQREGLDLAWLTGSAAVVGDLGPTQSRTAVKLHALAIRLPSASNRSLQALEPHDDIAVTNAPTKRANDTPYSFEFAIDGRNQITARRNDFDATLALELDVAYRDPDLHVGGYIEFRRGTFELFGKRFELNRGSMQFDGGKDLNPEVSLVATYDPSTAGGSSVVVNVSGTLAKPQVAFYSERCPGEGAVVLLVSGRCPTEGDTSGSGTTRSNATQDAFAAGIIGGILTLGAQRQLGGLVPRLAVESSALGTRTRLKAGFETVPPFMRSLVERVYLQGAISTADQNAGGTNSAGSTTPDFLLELYFPNNIVGAGKVAPTTRSWGVDVTWEP